jgi:hypothetical protein
MKISLCKRCLLWTISEEKHSCILSGVRYVKHLEIGGNWYINEVSNDGQNWREIHPIPSFMYKEAND